jgi:hypothetical protein
MSCMPAAYQISKNPGIRAILEFAPNRLGGPTQILRPRRMSIFTIRGRGNRAPQGGLVHFWIMPIVVLLHIAYTGYAVRMRPADMPPATVSSVCFGFRPFFAHLVIVPQAIRSPALPAGSVFISSALA